MIHDKYVVKDVPQLPGDHVLHWMEHKIKGELLKKKPIHDQEHEDMLVKWGCKPEHTSKLTIRKDEHGVAYADRLYHILLHVRYWKEEGMHSDVVEKVEKDLDLNVNDLDLPKPKAEGHSAY